MDLRRTMLWGLAIGCGVLAVAQFAHAQPPDSKKRGRSASYSPEDRARRLQSYESYFKQLDTNHNGVLEPDEVQLRKSYVDRALQKAGIAPNYPVRISDLMEGLRKYYEGVAAGTINPLPPSSGGSYGPPRPGADPAAGSSSNAMGFGSSSSGRSWGGGPSSSSYSSSTSSGSSATASSKEARIRAYAANLFRQYDANHNGLLERDEWSQMSFDCSAADRNHDRVITPEEFSDWMVQYSLNRAAALASGSTASSSPSGTAVSTPGIYRPTTTGGKQKTYRALTATERLPKGLPDWFVQKDTNSDGMVSMAEFSGNWDNATAARFAEYDLNNDGFITADECLKVEKRRYGATTTASTTPSPTTTTASTTTPPATATTATPAAGTAPTTVATTAAPTATTTTATTPTTTTATPTPTPTTTTSATTPVASPATTAPAASATPAAPATTTSFGTK